MGCKIIEVKPLKKDQALKLFLNKVGDDIFPTPTLESTLKMIVDECAGLPLAIVTVAGSMKGMSDPHLWKNVLNELREQKRMVAGTEVDEFRILKFSYDQLKDEKIQHCFLCCALYPEDHEIQKDEIIEYWIEEGLIDEMQTRQAMKFKGHGILWKLEGNCLLEFIKDKYKGECVRMHDLLRDMALHITRTSPRFLVKAGTTSELPPEEHEWKEDILKVSLMYNYIKEIPSSLPSPKCPMLTTLLLSYNLFLTIPEYFFDHMLGLKILDLSYNVCLESLPNSVSRLENLTALLLRGCTHLRKIPSLYNLRVLKNGSYPLRKRWRTLSKIPDGILPNLSKVQYLGLDYKILLKVEEIKKLVKLESFRGRFLTAHDMSIFFNSRRDGLSWYNLHIGGLKVDPVNFGYFGSMNFIRCYGVDICGEPTLLPSDVQNLEVMECNDMRSLNDISGFQDATDLQECKIYDCEGIECFLSSWSNQLPSLRFLELSHLKNLKVMFEVEATAKSVPPPITFSSLKVITISFCVKIKKLFSPRLLPLEFLQNLEEIEVKYCIQLEEIIASEPEREGERVSKVILPKLKRLMLLALPALRNICSSSAVLVCDSIKDLEFANCLNLNIGCVFGSWFNPLQTLEILTLWRLNLRSVFDEEAPSLLAPPITAFLPLKSISVSNCHQLKKLFPLTLLLDGELSIHPNWKSVMLLIQGIEARGACRELSFGPDDELELNSGMDDDFDEAYESRQNKRNKKGVIEAEIVSSPRANLVAAAETSVFVNGVIHWKIQPWNPWDDETIVAFDLDEEKFSILPPPTGAAKNCNTFHLAGIRGNLWLAEHTHKFSNINLWVFNKDLQNPSWKKEFMIDCTTIRDGYSLVASFLLHPLDFQNEEGILSRLDGVGLVLYNVKTKTFTLLKEERGRFMFCYYIDGFLS
ncbi:hypothetical protein SLEP1_g10839 [Rubroshorea leprosula]|uniref:NB-ARC domain-containing protein n=1 Tax=Rubroshorea leprosula TaxID=152421 RepID=A0AAV5IHW1_9ROSI|nr:hypothetical protein SLEP1_g10839 [Rubroshorea leprosula]